MAAVTVGELRSLVEHFATALEANRADRAVVRGLRDLCTMFAGCDRQTVAAFMKIAGRAQIPTIARAKPLSATVVPALASLRAFEEEFARKDLNKSVDSLLSLLRARGEFSVPALVAAVRQEVASASDTIDEKDADAMSEALIDDYVKRLEAALGDERKFRLLFEELFADERVGQLEAVTIASRFYGRMPAGTSRAKALERVRERQEKLMDFKKRPSTAGRSAA
jgi:hypothetical protein